MKPKNCRFCAIADGDYQYTEVDEPICSDGNYIAIASIGALVEGWTLIVPRKHQLSMRDNYASKSLPSFINRLLPVLVREYGPLIAFEHGANAEGSITSCGTDHAHLHLVPYKDSLIQKMNVSLQPWSQCYASKIEEVSSKQEYLFYYEVGIQSTWDDPKGYLHILTKPISQFFRHLLATDLGMSSEADYKLHPHVETARLTRKTVSSLA